MRPRIISEAFNNVHQSQIRSIFILISDLRWKCKLAHLTSNVRLLDRTLLTTNVPDYAMAPKVGT
ncbi:hypothetical protein CS542_06125 [Pedobacter sp. IW39]|nr:hypothetical protein CS542_06125 [Pedobacter sp. IW39]